MAMLTAARLMALTFGLTLRWAFTWTTLMAGRDPAAGPPQMAAGHGRIFDVAIEQRRRIDAVMADAGQLAVPVGAQGD